MGGGYPTDTMWSEVGRQHEAGAYGTLKHSEAGSSLSHVNRVRSVLQRGSLGECQAVVSSVRGSQETGLQQEGIDGRALRLAGT